MNIRKKFGLSGAIFMKKYFWPLGMTLFHSTINATVSHYYEIDSRDVKTKTTNVIMTLLFQCNDTTINTSMTSGIAIETGLVLLLSLLPIVEKSIGRMTNLGEDNAVLIFQSIIVAYIVKTCKYQFH